MPTKNSLPLYICRYNLLYSDRFLYNLIYPNFSIFVNINKLGQIKSNFEWIECKIPIVKKQYSKY